ncbi:hypothetical protein EDD85DRAFT_785245 [Armillaria nabsnona]|nr:hypothetical protein EDD85DRAFT_785245 [Armillaria nabsnona]
MPASDSHDSIPVFSDDDLDTPDTPWKQDQWIREKLLLVPPPFRPLIPPEDLSVLALLALQAGLPPQDEAAVIPTMELDWSYDAPDTEGNLLEDTLSTIVVPSLKTLTRLHESFGQAWFDGKQSLMDRCTGGPPRRYPMWMKEYFYSMWQVCRISLLWSQSLAWLEQEVLTEEESCAKHEVYTLLEKTKRWWGCIPGFGDDVYLEFLADILGDKALYTSVVDVMSALLSLRLHDSTPNSHTLIATTTFPDSIFAEVWLNNPGANRYLEKYCTWFHTKCYDNLLFAFHVPPFHWAACLIDFKNGQIHYGDSLQLPCHNIFLGRLEAWLNEKFSDLHFVLSNDLPCMIQSNGFNCSMISMNTIAHEAFGDPLWTKKRSHLQRMETFCEILNALMDLGHREDVMSISQMRINGDPNDQIVRAQVNARTPLEFLQINSRIPGKCPHPLAFHSDAKHPPKRTRASDKPLSPKHDIHPFFTTHKTAANLKQKTLIRPSDTKSRVATAAAEKSSIVLKKKENIVTLKKTGKATSRKAADIIKKSLLVQKGLPPDHIKYGIKDGGQSRSSVAARRGNLEIQLGVHKREPKRMINF